jgi:hypothetical protein
MGYGDAYYFAVVLKDCNVDEYKEFLQIRKDFNKMVREELDNHTKETPRSMRFWHLYDIFINRNIPWDTSASQLVYDNLAIEHISSDDWHKGYDAVSKAPKVCRVDYFIYNYTNKAWIGENLKRFGGHWMAILSSHYDDNEEFLERFKVKEVK